MEIALHIIREAEEAIMAGQTEFPMQIKSAPEFFVTTGLDETIQAFASFHHEGVEYKIGTQKKVAVV